MLANGVVTRAHAYHNLTERGGKIREKVVEEDGGDGAAFAIFLNRIVQ